jgi:putative ABC transport system ATP-binding protein
MIELKLISKEYHIGNVSLAALTHISLSIPPGSFTGICGPSGSGKSTLLNILGLIDIPSAGEYLLYSKPVPVSDKKGRSLLRKQYFGFIFQNFNLIPELDVYRNIELPLLINNIGKKERTLKIDKIIDETGLSDWVSHKPFQLSGGQQQRVAIARALVKEPPVVIADEPTANLDTAIGAQIVEIMKTMNTKHGTVFIISSHDSLVINKMDKVFTLRDGILV